VVGEWSGHSAAHSKRAAYPHHHRIDAVPLPWMVFRHACCNPPLRSNQPPTREIKSIRLRVVRKAGVADLVGYRLHCGIQALSFPVEITPNRLKLIGEFTTGGTLCQTKASLRVGTKGSDVMPIASA
jgi:hypothetical protein